MHKGFAEAPGLRLDHASDLGTEPQETAEKKLETGQQTAFASAHPVHLLTVGGFMIC
jgi:hypothetical protein